MSHQSIHSVIAQLKDPTQRKILVAAPMAGISNRPFRKIMRKLGSDVSVSELISAKGLIFGGKKTIHMIRMCAEERPVGIQLFGEDVPSLCDAAKIVEQNGADFIDINFGCPVVKVVRRGAGAGWLKRDLEFGNLLEAMVNAVKIPITIKIRTGWDSDCRNASDLCRIAEESGISWVAIHGRTRTQAYKGLADWDFMNEVVSKVKIPIIGNGDILTKSDLLKRDQTFLGRGLMVGRGILHDPLLMTDSKLSYTEVFTEYANYMQEDFNPQICIPLMKRMAAWYTAGIPNGNQFRKTIFGYKKLEEVLAFTQDFLSDKNPGSRSESFQLLMGGHG